MLEGIALLAAAVVLFDTAIVLIRLWVTRKLPEPEDTQIDLFLNRADAIKRRRGL